MKKVYKSLAVAAAVCLSSMGQAAAEEVVSHVFSDLTSTSTSNYSFTVEGNTVTVRTGGLVDFANNSSAISSASCDGTLNIPANKSFIRLAGTSTNPQSYLIVTFPASTTTAGIRKVAIYGKSGSGNIEVFYAHTTAASPTALTDFTDDRYLDDNGEGTVFNATFDCLSISGSEDLPTGTTGVVFLTSGSVSSAFLGYAPTASNVTNGATKPFQIYAITITAVKNITTGVEPAVADKTAVLSSYYDLTGKVVSAGSKGFVIRKTIYSDGSVANEKVYNY